MKMIFTDKWNPKIGNLQFLLNIKTAIYNYISRIKNSCYKSAIENPGIIIPTWPTTTK